MADITGLYRLNELYVTVLLPEGGQTTLPVRIYEEADYRPSLRFLPSADDYAEQHPED